MSTSGQPFEAALNAVERAAAEILQQADAEARRRIEAAEAQANHISLAKAAETERVADEMLAHANSVSERADVLLRAIDDAIGSLSEEPVEDAVPEPEPVTQEPEPEEPEIDTAEAQSAEPAVKDPGPAPSLDVPPSSGPSQSDPPPRPLQKTVDKEESGKSFRDRVSLFGRQGREPEPIGSQAATPAQEPVRAAAGRPKAPGGSEGLSEGAVLLVTQMAVAGSSREQIETRLRNDFGIEDSGDLLDDLIG